MSGHVIPCCGVNRLWAAVPGVRLMQVGWVIMSTKAPVKWTNCGLQFRAARGWYRWAQ